MFEVDQGHTRGNHSWWKGIYDRIAQGGPDNEREERLSPIPERPSQQYRKNRLHPLRVPSLDSPPPPPSIIYEYTSLENSHSTVRPSLSHREQLRSLPNQFHDSRGGRNRNLRAGHNEMDDLTLPARSTGPIALQPILIPPSNRIELLSPTETQSSAIPVPGNDQEKPIFASSGITRSDSLLARIFTTRTSATVEEHSSVGRTDTISSRTTPSSPIPPTVSLPRLPLEHVSSRPTHNPQKQCPSRRHLPRPHIVLPAPLSPTCYSEVEAPRRMPEQSSPPLADRHSARALRKADQNNTARELSRFTCARLGRFNHVQSNKCSPVAARRPSDIESTSPAEPFQTQFSSRSHMVDERGVAPYPNLQSEPPRVPLLVRQTPILTTPSSLISPRRLRHTRGDVGEVRDH